MYDKNICTRHLYATQALAWVRVALPRGLACHIASTWVPRDIYPIFAPFLIILNQIKNQK